MWAGLWGGRGAGLSQEGRHSETFPNAGAHASRALAQSEPIEVHRIPDRARRLRDYRLKAALLGGMAVVALWLITQPEASVSILSKVLYLLMALAFAFGCAVCLRLPASDSADLRVDAHGVGDGGRRSARWDQVSSLKVTHFYNVAGDLEQIVFYFLGANDEVRLALSPPHEGQALLREVCAEPQSGSST